MPAGAPVGMLAAMDETTPAIQDYLGAIYDLAGTDKPVIGARLAHRLPQQTLKRVFAILLALVALNMLRAPFS